MHGIHDGCVPAASMILNPSSPPDQINHHRVLVQKLRFVPLHSASLFFLLATSLSLVSAFSAISLALCLSHFRAPLAIVLNGVTIPPKSRFRISDHRTRGSAPTPVLIFMWCACFS